MFIYIEQTRSKIKVSSVKQGFKLLKKLSELKLKAVLINEVSDEE